MRSWKATLFTAITFFGLAFTIVYSSCVKDSCEDLACKNGGSCADGQCRCPSGYEGQECETQTAYKFIGQYYGYSYCENYPKLVDTLDIFLVEEPSTVAVVRHGSVTDTIIGLTEGSNVEVDDVVSGNTAVYTNIVLDGSKITFFKEIVTNMAAAKKSVCTFTGEKP